MFKDVVNRAEDNYKSVASVRGSVVYLMTKRDDNETPRDFLLLGIFLSIRGTTQMFSHIFFAPPALFKKELSNFSYYIIRVALGPAI